MAIVISATESWPTRHPQTVMGLLEVAGVDNTVSCPELDQHKRAVETSLRRRYDGVSRSGLVSADVMREYVRYYKSFDKTYHVSLQLESIVSKGRRLPDVSPLVDANFMSELETLALTAAHDAAKLLQPLRIDVAVPGDICCLRDDVRARRLVRRCTMPRCLCTSSSIRSCTTR